MVKQRPPKPKIQFSLLWKITIPFMLLAMILGLSTTYFVNRMLTEEETEQAARWYDIKKVLGPIVEAGFWFGLGMIGK